MCQQIQPIYTSYIQIKQTNTAAHLTPNWILYDMTVDLNVDLY